jgi:hypothetical protein
MLKKHRFLCVGEAKLHTLCKSSWGFVEPAIMNFLASFHDGTANLECINRAYIVLIPKTSDAVTPGAFHPISL